LPAFGGPATTRLRLPDDPSNPRSPCREMAGLGRERTGGRGAGTSTLAGAVYAPPR
jgi:hypothetical protein